jgi:hypothetical protein
MQQQQHSASRLVLLDLTNDSDAQSEDDGPLDDEGENDTAEENTQETIQQYDDDIVIVCVDPAPINCGISVYDVKNKAFSQVITKSFFTSKDGDMGNARLLESVSSFIKNTALFHESNTIVFVENQSVGGSDNRAFSNSRNLAVQYCFQSVLGSDRCIPVSPSSVKAHFRTEFPLLERHGSSRSRQYRLDKKNAIAFGSRLVGPRLRQQILSRRNKKIDDSYDAVVINQYVLERFKLQYSTEDQRVIHQYIPPTRKKSKKTRVRQ